MMIMTSVIYATNAMQNSEEHRRDYLVWSSKLVQQYDMQYLAEEKVQTNYPNGIQPLRTTTNEVFTTFIIYECHDCETILTAENVKEMHRIEQKIVKHKDYVSFCKAVSSSDSSCVDTAYQSFARNFESSIDTLTQAQVDAKLALISSSLQEYYGNNYFFEDSFEQSNTVTKKARALFIFATPIEFDGTRFKTFNEDEKEQEKYFVDFSKEIREDVLGYQTDMHLDFYNRAWYEDKLNEFIQEDVKLLGLSFTAVYLYVAFHLQSIFLASVSMVGIGLSYPVSTFINRFIMQITVFNFINYIAIFVILGIAADDVFVFTD
jgi:hypothetical protein